MSLKIYFLILFIIISIFKKNIIFYIIDYKENYSKNNYIIRISNNFFRIISDINLENLYNDYINKIKVLEQGSKYNLNSNIINETKINKNIINKNNNNILKNFKFQNFNEKCFICEIEDNEVIFNPCKHGNICYNCSIKILETTKDCIICKSKISSIIKVDKIKKNIYIIKEELKIIRNN